MVGRTEGHCDTRTPFLVRKRVLVIESRLPVVEETRTGVPHPGGGRHPRGSVGTTCCGGDVGTVWWWFFYGNKFVSSTPLEVSPTQKERMVSCPSSGG